MHFFHLPPRPNGLRGSFCLLLFAVTVAQAQDVFIKRIELENEFVTLFYELKDTVRDRYYTVNLYSSRDNFLNPLQKLQGDVGIEVPPGVDRKIIVNARDE